MLDGIKFKVGEKVVYPAHGVGTILEIKQQQIIGSSIDVYIIDFPEEKMQLSVPVNRSDSAGLRRLLDKSMLSKIYDVLNGKPKRGNKMWSRRAQEYEAKINSGDMLSIAEVVRDLYKNVENNRSYSERSIYETALNRLASELAILEGIKQEEVYNNLIDLLKGKLMVA